MNELVIFLEDLKAKHPALYVAAVKDATKKQRLAGLSDFASDLVNSVDKYADKFIKTKADIELVKAKIEALKNEKKSSAGSGAVVKVGNVSDSKTSQILNIGSGFTTFEKISLGFGAVGVLFAGMRFARG